LSFHFQFPILVVCISLEEWIFCNITWFPVPTDQYIIIILLSGTNDRGSRGFNGRGG
jgi:hypothetical protein